MCVCVCVYLYIYIFNSTGFKNRCVFVSSVRYNGLSEPLQRRRETLEAWQVLFQFYRDQEEEVAWLSVKLPSVTTREWGGSPSSTQQLLLKHQVTSLTHT